MRKLIAICLAFATCIGVWSNLTQHAEAAVNDGSPFIMGAWQLQSDIGEGVSLASYEESLGIRFTQHKWYVDWDQSFPVTAATTFKAQGKKLEITWQPWIAGVGIAFGDIAAGTYDSYIRQFARDTKSFGDLVQVAIAPEMDGWWSPWAINGEKGRTNVDYINGYRRIVTIFNEEKATNVSWVWAPNVQAPGGPQRYTYAELYPGDPYVTYMGMDGYNWGTTNGGTWQSFEQVFRYSYDAQVALSSKPILLMEVGSAEEGGSKPQWIRDMFAGFKNFPQIAGFTWFNRKRERDWRIHSSEDSKTAFREAAAAFFAPPNTGGGLTNGSTKTTPKPTSTPTSTPTSVPEPTNAAREAKQQPISKPSPTPATPSPSPEDLAPIPEIIQTFVNNVKGFWRDGAAESPGFLLGAGLFLACLGFLVVPRNRRRLAMLARVALRKTK